MYDLTALLKIVITSIPLVITDLVRNMHTLLDVLKLASRSDLLTVNDSQIVWSCAPNMLASMCRDHISVASPLLTTFFG